jgi:hypothetical protein
LDDSSVNVLGDRIDDCQLKVSIEKGLKYPSLSLREPTPLNN